MAIEKDKLRAFVVQIAMNVVSLKWESAASRQYRLEMSSDLAVWTPLASNLTATGADFTVTTNVPEATKFICAYRMP